MERIGRKIFLLAATVALNLALFGASWFFHPPPVWPSYYAHRSMLTTEMQLPSWVNQRILQNKMFSSSLLPVEILPYYVRSEQAAMWGERHAEFSIVTMLPLTRTSQLPLMCQRWHGPISATLFINGSADLAETIRTEVTNTIRTIESDYNCMIDVHAVLHATVPQLNLGRNLARLYARTAHFLLLDVDFVPDPGLRDYLEGNALHHVYWLSHPERPRILVVPAFELYYNASVTLSETSALWTDQHLPTTAAEVRRMWNDKTLFTFHRNFVPGHASTDQERWQHQWSNYQVRRTDRRYEPYYIGGPMTPWCDERFYGFGSNKCACAIELWMAGYEFWVVAGHFLLHQFHVREVLKQTRDSQDRTNLQLLSRFVRDMTHKYNRESPWDV